MPSSPTLLQKVNAYKLSAESSGRGHRSKVCLSISQVLRGVNRRLVNAHFIMEVRPRRLASHTDRSDNLAFLDFLSANDINPPEVSVLSCDAISMVHKDLVPITGLTFREQNDAVGGYLNFGAGRCRDVNPAVDGLLTIQRI